MTSIRGWKGKVFASVVGVLALSACVAPEPAPYYYAPGYYSYAPGYYAPPTSTFVFSYHDDHGRPWHGHHYGR
jgi:hypothetical protein